MVDTVYENGCLVCEESCVGICLKCAMNMRGLTGDARRDDQELEEESNVEINLDR